MTLLKKTKLALLSPIWQKNEQNGAELGKKRGDIC